MQLPELREDGSVLFADRETVDACWTAYLSGGALAVRSARALRPKDRLQVFLLGAGIPSPVPLHVEVMEALPDFTLLRLLDAAPPRTALGDGVATATSSRGTPRPDTPSSAPPVPSTSASKVPAMPPVFTGDTLRFANRSDVDGARHDLLHVGATLAVCDGAMPTSTREVRLAVGARETTSRVAVSFAPAAVGTVVVQAVSPRGFQAALRELDAPPVPEPARPAAETYSLARSGTLRNPTTVTGLLALPLTRPLTRNDVINPSAPLLLRWLRTSRGHVRLELTSADQPELSLTFVDGKEVRSAAPLAQVAKALAQPTMGYRIVPVDDAPRSAHVHRPVHLLAEVVQQLCAEVPLDAFSRAFPIPVDKHPRAVPQIVPLLGLSEQQQRFVKTSLGGDRPLDMTVPMPEAMRRAAWQALTLLQLFDGLHWETPHAREATPQASAPEDPWAFFDGKNHFQVFGLHWSSSPTEIIPAFQRLRTDYGLGGLKRPQDEQLATKIMARIDEAFVVLKNTSARREYRRSHFDLNWAVQADLLVQQGKVALERGRREEAKNFLFAAEDLEPASPAVQSLKELIADPLRR